MRSVPKRFESRVHRDDGIERLGYLEERLVCAAQANGQTSTSTRPHRRRCWQCASSPTEPIRTHAPLERRRDCPGSRHLRAGGLFGRVPAYKKPPKAGGRIPFTARSAPFGCSNGDGRVPLYARGAGQIHPLGPGDRRPPASAGYRCVFMGGGRSVNRQGAIAGYRQ